MTLYAAFANPAEGWVDVLTLHNERDPETGRRVIRDRHYLTTRPSLYTHADALLSELGFVRRSSWENVGNAGIYEARLHRPQEVLF